jgi:PAS domain S-box-containing protein
MASEVGAERLIDYEARLNDLPPSSGLRILCLYDRGEFAPEVIRGVLRTHPLAIVGEHVHDNPYFEPSAVILGGENAEARRVEWMLDQLQKRTQRAVALAQLGSWALEQVPPGELVAAAAQFIAHELRAEFVEVFDLAGGEARRIASVGLSADQPGARQGADGHVWPGADSTRHHLPVLVPDWRQEDRIAQRADLEALGITSSAAIPIGARDGQAIEGVMWVHSVEPRIFSEDELVLADTVGNVLAQTMGRSRADGELRTLLDISPDVIARFDRDLRHVYVNPAIEQVTGLPASSLIGKTSREAGLPDALAPAWELLLQQAWRSGREQVTEFGVPTPLGERRFETRILPEFDPGPDGSVRSLLSISRDVTEQRQAEAERAALYREVVAQQGRLTELLARLEQDRAHDVKRSAHTRQAEQLTARERDVLRLLTRGWSNREIATELRLAPGTVKNHVAILLAKLDASDRTQAAARAVNLGIAQPD